jgi:hypothetical protein
VDFVAADMPSVNRLTVHVLAAVAEHEREMISQRTRAALAAARVHGTKLGNPRLPATGTLAAAPQPSKPGGKARVASAQACAVTAYGPAIQAVRSAGALSLGDYAQALQSARLPAPRGRDHRSRPSVARVLRYCTPAGVVALPLSGAEGGLPKVPCIANQGVFPCCRRYLSRDLQRATPPIQHTSGAAHRVQGNA